MTLYDDWLGGTEHTFTHTTSTNNNFGDIVFSKMATSWKCACHPNLNIKAHCPDPNEEAAHDGEYIAYIGFGNYVLYERTTRDPKRDWVYLRFATDGKKWEVSYKSKRLKSGGSAWNKGLKDLNFNLKGTQMHSPECCNIKYYNLKL